MGHAYYWLSERDKNNIKSIFIYYAEKEIQVGLDCPSETPNFVYEDVGGMTCVRYGKKDDLLQKNFVDVFCDDLHLLLTNQQLTLGLFFLVYQSDGDPNQKVLDTMIAKVFKTIKRSFASRESLFPVNNITLEPCEMSQAAPILKYLDPSKLESFHLSFVQRKEQIQFEEQPLDWNKDYKFSKFSLSFIMESVEDWFTTDKFPSLFPIFHNIQIYFEIHQLPYLIEIMANNEEIFKHGKIDFDSNCVKFIREGPAKARVEENDVESPVSTVAEKISVHVLENPLILKLILTEFQLFEIQTLRKVSPGIRNCIDELKPNMHIETYQISLGSSWSPHFIDDYSQIEIIVDTESNAHRTVRYHKKGFPGEEEFENDEDLCPLALKEIESNLRHQKTCIEQLQVIYQYFYAALPYDQEKQQFESLFWIEITEDFSLGFEEILKSRRQYLKVRKMTLGMENQAEIMRILPYLDKKCLKTIEFLYPTKQAETHLSLAPEHLFEIDEVSKTEQWKSAEQFISKYIIITTLVSEMNITHFANVEILVLTMSSEDVFYLKNNLLKSSTFQKFRIAFKDSVIDETLHLLIGVPYRTIPDVKKIWYFRMADLNYYLHIVLDTHSLLNQDGNPRSKILALTKVRKEDTPFSD